MLCACTCDSFLPLCSHSKILGYSASNKPTRQSDNGAIKGDGTLRFDAVLTVGLPPFFEETYVSAVTVKPNQLTVETRSISSKLFDSLRSRWQLSYVQDNANKISNLSQCKVHFEVEMTVSDPLVVGTLDTVLEQVAGRQVQAFADRCHQIPMPLDLRQ
jgi:ribosome-associated toxin RatA of RatAB toxin-antitoxin module